MYICPYCGNQLEGQPKFCRFCGNSLSTQESPVPAYQPPAPVYEPPAPVYEQPVYQYDQPAYQYEQPAPVYEQPVYEQPTPVYEQPAPVYEQPVYDYAYPAQDAVPETKPAKKSKTGLIAGIAIALVAVVLAVLFLPKLLGGNDHIGTYNVTSMTMMGMTASGSELEGMGAFWIELKSDNKCTMHFDGNRSNGTWKVDGDQISCTVDGETMTGTIRDGKLEMSVNVEGIAMSFVFEKDAAPKGNSGAVSNDPDTDGTEPATIETKAPNTAQLDGYWTLQRAESADPANAMTEDEVQKMRETLDTELFLVLNADGTGVGSFYSETRVTWGDGVLTMRDLGIKCMYTLEGNELTLVMDFDAGVRYVYVPGTGEAPELDMYVDTESDSEFDSESDSDID